MVEDGKQFSTGGNQADLESLVLEISCKQLLNKFIVFSNYQVITR